MSASEISELETLLRKFYGVDNTYELLEVMSEHIEVLQEKLATVNLENHFAWYNPSPRQG